MNEKERTIKEIFEVIETVVEYVKEVFITFIDILKDIAEKLQRFLSENTYPDCEYMTKLHEILDYIIMKRKREMRHRKRLWNIS